MTVTTGVTSIAVKAINFSCELSTYEHIRTAFPEEVAEFEGVVLPVFLAKYTEDKGFVEVAREWYAAVEPVPYRVIAIAPTEQQLTSAGIARPENRIVIEHCREQTLYHSYQVGDDEVLVPITRRLESDIRGVIYTVLRKAAAESVLTRLKPYEHSEARAEYWESSYSGLVEVVAAYKLI